MASKRIAIIVTALEKQGCTVRTTGKKGFLVKLPDGVSMPDGSRTITMHSTESDHRAEANTRGRVLRAGLTWPFDPK